MPLLASPPLRGERPGRPSPRIASARSISTASGKCVAAPRRRLGSSISYPGIAAPVRWLRRLEGLARRCSGCASARCTRDDHLDVSRRCELKPRCITVPGGRAARDGDASLAMAGDQRRDPAPHRAADRRRCIRFARDRQSDGIPGRHHEPGRPTIPCRGAALDHDVPPRRHASPDHSTRRHPRDRARVTSAAAERRPIPSRSCVLVLCRFARPSRESSAPDGAGPPVFSGRQGSGAMQVCFTIPSF